jgi:hypothetical protein
VAGAVDQLVLDDGDRLSRGVVTGVCGKRQDQNENSVSEKIKTSSKIEFIWKN